MQVDVAALEHAIEEITEVNAAIEVDGGRIVVTGIVDTPEEHQAVLDIIHELAPDTPVEDNLALGAVMPGEIGELSISEAEAAGFAGGTPQVREIESLEPGDFTDQGILYDPGVASGPGGTHADDDVSDGDQVYVPPTDPPSDREGNFLGGFRTTSDQDDVAPRSEVVPGPADSAIEEAVLVELREDAATTALEIEVTSLGGIVILRGIVDDIEDVENAEAVAARVEGVLEVRDELQIRA